MSLKHLQYTVLNAQQSMSINTYIPGLCSNAFAFASANANAALAFHCPVMDAFALVFAFDNPQSKVF